MARTQATNAGALAFLSRPDKRLLIAGEWVEAREGGRMPCIDPATGEQIGSIAIAGPEDVDAAVAAARAALKSGSWPGLTPAQRGGLLWRVAELLEQHLEELAELETLDQGKPLGVGLYAEIPGGIGQFRYFAGQASKIEGATIPTSIDYQPPGKRIFAYTRPEPVGVVAAIVPWNSPLVLTAMKLAPALAAGCTVVLKPAEDTSLTAIRLGELFTEAGFPPGVLNIVTGPGNVTGVALARHVHVDKVAFTGSTETGRAILDAAKGNLKRVSLELGGKSPVIVLPDADLELAIPGIAQGIFFNAGQVCVAGSRLYCHSELWDELLDGLCAQAADLKLGHGLDPETQLGPLVSRLHAGRVMQYIESGIGDGAQKLAGGECGGDNESFVMPTILAGVRPDMAIVREEIFGPVLVAATFDDTDEVIAQANDSHYGLAASVWTENLSAAHRLAEQIEAGTVWINGHSLYDASLPIGGIKQSGWGRDSGRRAVENYQELKTVCAVI
ncbi:MAG: aldehyde dehydrogenase family protein [Gammaproteobacteria bacterium]|nr:MAG: aldehyde dehydrogenase family protein [Gammaproteobacteria bacterium]